MLILWQIYWIFVQVSACFGANAIGSWVHVGFFMKTGLFEIVCRRLLSSLPI